MQMAQDLTAQNHEDSPKRARASELPEFRHVLMIAPTSFFADYGCHVRIYEEARVLQKLGHRVTIATYHNGNDIPGMDIRRTLPIPWRRNYEVGSSRHKIVFDLLLGLRVCLLLLRHRYDVLHCHLHEGALIGLVLGYLFRVPIVFDFQGSLTEEMIDHGFIRRDSLIYGSLRRLERWITRSSPVIFTSSANAERVLLEQFDCSPDQIQPLPDCVDTDTFQPAAWFAQAELDALRQQLGIASQSKVIVYVGLLAQYQGTDLLLEAMARILQERSGVYLLLMGFPNVTIYQAQAQALGIEDSVVFTGRMPYRDLPKHLALGDVAVAPKLSLTESAGKLLNYMAAGLPTVAFDTPVAREYLGLDGILATRGDSGSLAEKLLQALFPSAASEDGYSHAGKRLRQRAIQLFEWQDAGRMIVEAYQILLGNKTSKRSHKRPALRRS